MCSGTRGKAIALSSENKKSKQPFFSTSSLKVDF